MNLFCVPHAGGSGTVYRGLAPHLADFIHLHPLEFPGRGRRLLEPLLHDMAAIVGDLCRQISCTAAGPYAIYGHSMGALAGCLLVERLAASGQNLPRHLFVSGRKTPGPPQPSPSISRLPRDAFLDQIFALGGTPPEIVADRDFLHFIEPVLRADFTAIENCMDRSSGLAVPVSVMIGKEEGLTEEDAWVWRRICDKGVEFFDFPGGHFFIFEHWPQIGRIISSTLRPYAPLSASGESCVNG